MVNKYLAASLVLTTCLGTAALAQTSVPANPPSSNLPATAAAPAAPADKTITDQLPGQWRASKLIGVDVYGPDDKKIGDIAEILLDHNGMAESVVIGVGGFLGIGQKDVAIPFKSIEWTNKPEPSTTATSAPSQTKPSGTDTTGSIATAPAPRMNEPVAAEARRGYPDRAVLRMTKAQLESAPDFHYAGDSSARTDQRAAPPPSSPAPAAPPKQ